MPTADELAVKSLGPCRIDSRLRATVIIAAAVKSKEPIPSLPRRASCRIWSPAENWETTHSSSRPFLSLKHLIANKRATGRPQDLADIARLQDASN